MGFFLLKRPEPRGSSHVARIWKIWQCAGPGSFDDSRQRLSKGNSEWSYPSSLLPGLFAGWLYLPSLAFLSGQHDHENETTLTDHTVRTRKLSLGRELQ